MSVNMFDILGPITVGPSSSHTAGAVRIGLLCRMIMGEEIKKARITFYGSFADTYKGHGTDKAVVGGLLGYNTFDVRVRDSLDHAVREGLEYEIVISETVPSHPNTVRIEAEGAQRHVDIKGISVGGGSIRLVEINGSKIEVTCQNDTLLIFNRNTAGAIATVASILAGNGYNIGNMRITAGRADEPAITVIETDRPVDDDTVAAVRSLHAVLDVTKIPEF